MYWVEYLAAAVIGGGLGAFVAGLLLLQADDQSQRVENGPTRADKARQRSRKPVSGTGMASGCASSSVKSGPP
jgi:hypothetical protein